MSEASGEQQFRFEIKGTSPRGDALRFVRGTAVAAVNKAAALAGFGFADVVVADTEDGLEYRALTSRALLTVGTGRSP